MTEFVNGQPGMLNRLYKEGNELYYETAAGLGLSPSALMILYGLSYMGRSCSQKELCDIWYLKKQTIHSALNKLLESGDVRIQSSTENAHNKLVALTPKGKALCDRTAVPFIEAEKRAFGRLTKEEQRTLYKLTIKHTTFIREEAGELLNQIQKWNEKD